MSELKTWLEIPVTVNYDLDGEDIVIKSVTPDPMVLTPLQHDTLIEEIHIEIERHGEELRLEELIRIADRG